MEGVRLSELGTVLRTAPAQRLIKFFERQTEWARTGTAPPPKRSLSKAPLDQSECLKLVQSVLPYYRTAMVDLGISEDLASTYLEKYNNATVIPPIEEILEQFYSEEKAVIPYYLPLDLTKLQSKDTIFECSSGIPTPNGLQNAIINHIIENIPPPILKDQPLRGVIVLATGLGKTYLAIFILARFLSVIHGSFRGFISRERGVVLFLVNSSVIRDQAFYRFKTYFSRLFLLDGDSHDPRIEVESLFLKIDLSSNTASAKAALPRARFVFCLFQSLHFLKLQPETFTRFHYVIIDEVHHIMAPQYYSGLCALNSHPKLRLLIGLTATLLHRTDPSAIKIKTMFDNNVFVDLPWTAAKELNFFPDVKYYEYGHGSYQRLIFGLKNRTATIQDFLSAIRKSLDRGVTSEGRAVYNDIVRFILQKKCRRSIIFFNSVEDTESFISFVHKPGTKNESTDLHENHKIEFLPVHYRVKKQDLVDRFTRFCSSPSEHDHLVLLTVGMATEGFDLQFIDMVAMLRRTESERIFVQQLGRGLRKYQGKDVVYVLDYVYGLRSRWLRRATTTDLDLLRAEILAFWPVTTLPPPLTSGIASAPLLLCEQSGTSSESVISLD